MISTLGIYQLSPICAGTANTMHDKFIANALRIPEEWVAEYEQVLPGARERLARMADLEVQHKIYMNENWISRLVKSNFWTAFSKIFNR